MAAAKRSGGMARNILTVIVAAPLVFIFMPTVIFLGIAMLPTFVAAIVDRSPRRFGGITVGGLNFAGAAPYAFDLWLEGEHSVQHALTIMQDVWALTVIFGSAGIGWLIYVGTPAIVASYLGMTSTRRLANLRNKQKQMIEEWGPEVARADEIIDVEPGSALDD